MGKKLYVGNLSYSTTEASLSEAFSAFGEVVSVNLITDQMTGRSRGFGFVEMVDDAAAKAAIEGLNGKPVDGRNLRVDEARPQRERENTSWGGGGGGGGGRGRRR